LYSKHINFKTSLRKIKAFLTNNAVFFNSNKTRRAVGSPARPYKTGKTPVIRQSPDPAAVQQHWHTNIKAIFSKKINFCCLLYLMSDTNKTNSARIVRVLPV
jgi:hypothetical protein